MIARATNSSCEAKPLTRLQRQRGAAAVEFAIAFPLFFLVLYAIITFCMIFLVQHSLTAASADGARAALVYVNAQDTATALSGRAQAACARALQGVTWLATAPTCTTVVNAQPSGCTNNTAMDCIQVTLSYPWSTSPLVPTLPMLGAWQPTTLAGRATVQIDPVNLL
ncbi:TadE family protein [Paraburkholderia sp. Ac-20347]|uniref:TadE/TadG family type IV pilus assembly protein n=1 Tax=Paraburkholderia sp. Ac-20347 TaxID=2703892 RepID=UPI00197E0A38|nr:TadE family protein [Paraburkholderia sp. Ac-20347]MBN3814451.1 pilus assembly protein [Paraburkholderia sp. Ac-20347]